MHVVARSANKGRGDADGAGLAWWVHGRCI